MGYGVQMCGSGGGRDIEFKYLGLEVEKVGIQGSNVWNWKWRRREFRV